MKAFVSVILIAFLLWGCSDKNNDRTRILPKEKMTTVLWDIMRANSYTELFIKKDSLKNGMLENMKLQQQIFTLHNVSKDDFYKSYNYYSAQPDQMRAILDSVAARGERSRVRSFQQKTPVITR